MCKTPICAIAGACGRAFAWHAARFAARFIYRPGAGRRQPREILRAWQAEAWQVCALLVAGRALLRCFSVGFESNDTRNRPAGPGPCAPRRLVDHMDEHSLGLFASPSSRPRGRPPPRRELEPSGLQNSLALSVLCVPPSKQIVLARVRAARVHACERAPPSVVLLAIQPHEALDDQLPPVPLQAARNHERRA